jgi:single-strand DNA-binding protein
MAGINKCSFIGRLGRKPECKYTKSGKAVCSFSIAVQERKDQPTTWINLVAWEKLAEIIAEHLDKGSLIYVEGRLQIREYEDNDGNKKQATEIVVRDMTMLGQSGSGSASSGSSQSSPPSQGSSSGPEDFEDDDIPF